MLHTRISEGCTCPVAISPLFSALDGSTWPLMEHGGFLESGSSDVKKEKPGGGAFPQRLQVLGSASRARWIFRPGLTRNFGGSRKPGAAGRTAEGWGIGDGKKGFFGRMDLQGSCQATGAALLPPAPLLPPEQAWGECVLVSPCPCIPVSLCPGQHSPPWPCHPAVLAGPSWGRGCSESREHMGLEGPTHPAQAWAGPCQQQGEKSALSSNLTATG